MKLHSEHPAYILLRTAMAALFFLLTGCAANKDNLNSVSIKGSTSVLPIAIKAAEKYMDKTGIKNINITSTGSGHGIRALLDGLCDIAISSRALNSLEIIQSADKGVAFEEMHIAYDMIVPIVHPENRLNTITSIQLHDIFTGKINKWKEINPSLGDRNILVVSRDSSSGTFSVFSRKIVSESEISKSALRAASNSAMIITVSSSPASIGYVSFGYLNTSVSPLAVDGITPDIKNCVNGIYPLSRKLYVIIDRNNIKQAMLDFVDYLLSGEGQEVVKEAGFIPLY